MREDADRSRQAEHAARQRRGEAELAIDHRRGAIDVHRDQPPLALFQAAFDGARCGSVAAGDAALADGSIDERQQAAGTRVDRVEAVTETGQVFAVRRSEGVD